LIRRHVTPHAPVAHRRRPDLYGIAGLPRDGARRQETTGPFPSGMAAA